jgi:hypothetical protein
MVWQLPQVLAVIGAVLCALAPAVGLPVALTPLWQVAQLLPLEILPWANEVGFHADVLWQLSHCAYPVVGMCVVFLPVALTPLWQLVQLPAVVTLLWSNEVGVHQVVLWHTLHCCPPVGIWPDFKPVALVPLWQSVQFLPPSCCTVCANEVGIHAAWLWQTLHCSVVLI